MRLVDLARLILWASLLFSAAPTSARAKEEPFQPGGGGQSDYTHITIALAEGRVEHGPVGEGDLFKREGHSLAVAIPGLTNGAKRLELVLVDGRSSIKPFLMGKYEVTQGQFEAVMARKPSYFKLGPDDPVEQVTWDEAKEFCAKLTAGMPSELKSTYTFRLPTDAEWSLAVGLPEETGTSPAEKDGGNQDLFPWGVEWPPPEASGNYGNQFKDRKRPTQTIAVGSFRPNQYGLHDLGGNVWEWCEDWYSSQHAYRVLRGAAWNTSFPGFMLSSYRSLCTPGHRMNNVGFRVVLGVASPRCADAEEVPSTGLPPFRDIEEEYWHRAWTRESGLPDNEVTAILKTQDGYLWVATPFALARFDGTRFVVFDQRTHPQLFEGRLYRLVEDNSATLWIGTSDRIYTYSCEGIERLPFAFGNSLHQPIAPATGDGVWLFTERVPNLRQLEHVTRRGVISTNTIRFKNAAHSGYIDSLINLPDGRFWVGDDTGAYLLDASFCEVQKVQFPHAGFLHFPVLEQDGTGHVLVLPLLDNEKLAQLYRLENGRATLCATNLINTMGRIPFLTRDRMGNLWMPGGQTCLLRYAHGQMTRFQFPGGCKIPAYSREDPEGSLWLGGYPSCAHADRDGNLWFGTTDGGLHCLRPRRIRALTPREDLAGTTPDCLLQTRDGSIWIGTANGLLRFATNGWTRFDDTHGLVPPVIRALAEDHAGVLWVGTLGGLHSFENGRFVHHVDPIQGEFQNRVRAIIPARTGGLWAATAGGLVRAVNGRQVELTTQNGRRTADILSLLEDQSGALWAGIRGRGLDRLTWPNAINSQAGAPLDALTNVTMTSFTATNGLSGNNVWALHQDPDGVLWAGTDNGLARWENGHWFALTSAHGLPENQVNELLEDDSGWFWIGGDRSLYRVSRKELNRVAAGIIDRVVPIRYDQSDGLPSLEVSGKLSHPAMCATRDGRICIATVGGVAMVDPKNLPDDPNAPQVVIEQIRANGQIVFDNTPPPTISAAANSSGPRQAGTQPVARVTHLRSPIPLAPGTARILEITYTATTVISPEATRFKHRLEGWDKQWIDAGTARRAYYANLPPGEYRFHLLAADRNGRWGDREATASFQLAPFFYETPWFYALCGGLLISGTYFGVASRIRKKRQIAELERQIALNEQRKRIARDLHDELGASLTQIAQLTADVEEAPGDPELRLAQNQRIAALAEEAVANIGEIVWANNPRYDTIEDLVAFLREYAARYLGATALEYHLLFPQELPCRAASGLFRRHLLAVLKEGLHNVIKHSGAQIVEVHLELDVQGLELAIRDDGVGIAADTPSRFGNGLTNMRERAAELGGTCEVTTGSGPGTKLRFKVPLPAAEA
jgi:signal transduction histidine kinase/ligand-binding sensor domain-containing protein